ncbi:uncharacterized protein ARMOST_14306 [Armillaria ostoyae]|uniref:Uncharacterized protein n=1 Tax=Armillaria ostoyae TaxID=47428 RepID=A0A284RQ85_ARMOS|nr:uncharacterized protein ARMOST_14306 [Armillaria ostoyae]
MASEHNRSVDNFAVGFNSRATYYVAAAAATFHHGHPEGACPLSNKWRPYFLEPGFNASTPKSGQKCGLWKSTRKKSRKAGGFR